MMSIVKRNGDIYHYDQSQNILLKKVYSSLIGRASLKVMTLPLISKIGGIYMNSPLSKPRIKRYINDNHIDMKQFEERSYRSFNDFFTRRLKSGARVIDEDKDVLIAPCDSKLSVYAINEDSILKVKETPYKLDDLFLSPTISDLYQGGQALLFRLTVDDYHRYHFIDDGTQEKDIYIPGIYHTVNPIANDYYPIYKTNSRSYSVLHTEHFGDVVMMEVGAMMVGKIRNHPVHSFRRGDEKGYFEFGGSTIILLFRKDCIKLDSDIIENSRHNNETKVLFGERIGIRLNN